MSNTCLHCGGEIIFRYIDGVLKPLHLSGDCSGYEAPPKPTHRAWPGPHDDFFRPSKCPYCQLPVFFIRHNDGSVWVDDLGWPWPKHACFDVPSLDNRLDKLSELLGRTRHRSPLGLIVKAALLSDQFTPLLVRHNDGSYVRYLVEGGSIDLVGELAVHVEEVARLFTSLRQYPSLRIIRLEPANRWSSPDAYWTVDGRSSTKSGTVKQPSCPYCDRQIHYKKLIDHLCLTHGHDDATTSSLQVQCKICNTKLAEHNLLRHVLTDHVIKPQ